MQLIDLSHSIFDGLVTYKGLPAPVICDYLSRENSLKFYEPGTSFQIGRIDMIANTGTYLDCPFHRYEDGTDLDGLHLFQVANLQSVCIDARNTKAITADHFKNVNLKGKAVLVHTGWSANWNTSAYFENHPYITEDGAIFLREQEVALVGIDSHNIDDTATNKRPVHSILLKANILIVEHLTNLDLLPYENFLFSAVPPKIQGMGTFPVRAFAQLV
jgi:kynurenine formamidase